MPGVCSVTRSKHVAFDNLKGLAEFILQLALPLEGQISGGDDESSLYETSYLQFF